MAAVLFEINKCSEEHNQTSTSLDNLKEIMKVADDKIVRSFLEEILFSNNSLLLSFKQLYGVKLNDVDIKKQKQLIKNV